MATAVRGTKRRCPHCGAPFYDLNRDPIVCPKCEAEVKPEALAKVPARGARGPVRPVPPPAVEAEDVETFEEDEVLAVDEDEDESVVGPDEIEDDADEMRE